MRIRWRGFELPSRVAVEGETRTGEYAKFLLEPFERGFGTTIGNSLRRVLLSSLEGAAVTKIQIEGVQHEFDSVEGVYEDIADIVLNVKQLRVGMLHDEPSVMRIDLKREGEVTGADIATEAGVEVASKDLVICTLTAPVRFACEMTVAKGRGYVTADENESEDDPIGIIPVDSIFSPVLRVRYHVEDARVGQRINYDRLVLEVWTDGTLEPELALAEAGKILRKHLSPIVNLGEPGLGLVEGGAAAPALAGEDLDAILQMPLDELKLTVRAAHCLQNENINTVGDLVRCTEEDLLQLRNFGKTSLDEVNEKLQQYGLTLGMSAEVAADAQATEE